MNTSLVVVNTKTSAYKYEIAMCFFRTDMLFIKQGTATEINYDSTGFNMYIDEAIRLMH